MKAKYLFINLAIFFYFIFSVNAQNTQPEILAIADSLKRLIDLHDKEDEEKVRLLNEYARQCFYNQEIKKGFIATKEAREISEKLDFEGGEIMYYLTLSAYHGNGNEDMQIYYQKRAQWLSNSMGERLMNYYVDLEIPPYINFENDYGELLENFTAILEHFDSNKDKEIQANLLLAIALFNLLLNNVEETIKIEDQIIELFTDLNQVYPVFLVSTYKMTVLNAIGKVDEAKKIELDLIDLFVKSENENAIGLIANSMASGYAENGRYLLAIEYYLKSIEAFERIQDHDMLSQTYFDLAVAYENLNLNNKAYESYLKTIAQLELVNDSVYSNMVYGSMVFPTIAIQKYDEARKYMSLALHDTVHGNKAYLLARYNDANGQLLKKQGEYREAIPYFKKALELFQQTSVTWTAPFMPLYLTECYYEIGEYNTALEYGLRCLELEKSLNLNQTLTKKRASLWLAKIYEELDNIPIAYTYLKQYQEITEESEKLDELNRIADAEIQAVLEKSKKEIDELEQQRVLTNQQNRIQRLWIFSIAGALLSALILALILFRNNKNKQKANALLQQQKEEIQTTLEQLESTQSQLIQSEKMASLGELTAGIAHEIQNPLNFVNNFSEINSELIDEADDENEKGNTSEVRIILKDLKENESKISHHGKRAESIVKGMLLHSRNSSGKKEPTDINALCDEYLRLSYHGFRAKDKSFNADFKFEADKSLPKIEIVPQDIGRVLLNLINNAFYAVQAPPPPKWGIKEPQSTYKPLVIVRTSSFIPPSGGPRGASISVTDNGNGIPEEIKDKIFQPFFTTKSAGEGTGLGLSLSYDIVKAHGGELKVETTEGKGTEFTILLPFKG